MRLLKSETADATIIGQIVILAISIIGISTVMLYGVPTIYSFEDLANVKNVEQSLAVLDSRASRAILGDSPLQISNINLGGGTLVVEPNSTSTKSYMVVKSSNFNFTIPMGRIRYTLGDRIVAYEGGGLWSKYPSGGSVMLSPPEFHYNGVTLSLPAINISGSTSVSGKGTATISFKKNPPQVLYPNTSLPNRTNPVNTSTGKVYVNITSDFYDAWADYADGLGYAKVSRDSKNSTAILELSVVPNNLGENISIANPVVFRGLNESDATPLDNFSFWLDPFGNTFDWDIRASSGKKKLIFHIKTNAGQDVDLNIGYEDDGQGYSKPAETWAGNKILIVRQSGGQAYLAVDLLNTSLNLTYANKTVGADASCSPYKINDGKFNDTNGFSWNLTQTTQTAQTWQKKWWFFNDGTDFVGWVPSNTTTTGNVTMGFNSTDGNASGSIYSNITGNNNTNSTTTWISPNFTWNNGTPTSARLDFDWKVAKFDAGNNTSPGNFYVMLVKPDGSTSQINQTTTFNATANWSAMSNASISVNDFAVSGNYSIKLIATLYTPQAMQTTQYNKWWFNSSNESWTPTNTTTNGIVTMIFNSTDGNTNGSIHSNLSGSLKNAITTWTSPNFTWNNGIPTSARLDFDWKVANYSQAKPGNFYVKLVKPDGSMSQINQTTTFNSNSTWSTKSNTSVSVNDFSQSGNYSLKLIAELNTSSFSTALIEVGWDNPTITLNYTAMPINTTEVRWDNPAITLNYTGSSSGVSQLTNKSLYDITQHYFGIMAQDGDGTITFYQCSPSGKQAPASDSTMLMDYITPGGLTYLQISENRVDAGVS